MQRSWLTDSNERGRQSVGNTDSAGTRGFPATASSWFSLAGSSWAQCGGAVESWLAEEHLYLLWQWITTKLECRGFLLPGENGPHCKSGEYNSKKREGGFSPHMPQLSWPRGRLALRVWATFHFGNTWSFLTLAWLSCLLVEVSAKHCLYSQIIGWWKLGDPWVRKRGECSVRKASAAPMISCSPSAFQHHGSAITSSHHVISQSCFGKRCFGMKTCIEGCKLSYQ